MRRLAIVAAGARTTVEDLGRSGFACAGVPEGGAYDRLALVAANRLVGNPDGAAGLEVTLVGPELRNDGASAVRTALLGADAGASIAAGGAARRLSTGTAGILPPGATLRLGRLRDGARAWAAFAGGIDVPEVLQSRSTCLAAGFGGYRGRPLRAGDALELGPPAADPPPTRSPETAAAPALRDDAIRVLRILPGPQLELFPGDALFAFESTLWRVGPDSDRTGIRLEPLDPSTAARLAGVPGIAPEGTTAGAVQVPPDGRAIVLGPDRPVTGGYAKPVLVVRADHGTLAALRPGDRLRFQRIELVAAIELYRRREAALPPRAVPG